MNAPQKYVFRFGSSHTEDSADMKNLLVREMILADTETDRRKALTKLLPIQRGDFEGLFEAMDGLPVTIRLLDPPLHEFLPHDDANQRLMAADMQVSLGKIKMRVEELHEFNPMMGHRGCRLGISYPEITEMQARAVFEAALNMQAKGIRVKAETLRWACAANTVATRPRWHFSTAPDSTM